MPFERLPPVGISAVMWGSVLDFNLAAIGCPDRVSEPPFNKCKFQSSRGLSLHKHGSVPAIRQQLQKQAQQHALAEYVQMLETGVSPDGCVCASEGKQPPFLRQIKFYIRCALESCKGIQKHGQVKY